jgi:hypothetical protein
MKRPPVTLLSPQTWNGCKGSATSMTASPGAVARVAARRASG